MNHTETNRRLALAIGHNAKAISVVRKRGEALVLHCGIWKRFDYRDEGVIEPIAKRYRMTPSLKMSSFGYEVWRVGESDETCIEHVCRESCIAEAVIEAHERGLLP